MKERKSYFGNGQKVGGTLHLVRQLITRAVVGIGILILSFNCFATDESEEPIYRIDIPQLNAAEALNKLAEQTGSIMLFPYDLASARDGNAVSGHFTISGALTRLLRGTGLSSGLSDKQVIVISVDEAEIRNEGEGEMETSATKASFGRSIGVFFTSIFVATGASGQEIDGAGQPDSIEEIVVTAQRREQNVMDVPISIAVLSGKTIDQQGIWDLNDLALSIPDLHVTDKGGSGGRMIFIRGVGGMRGSSSLVGVYLNEASATNGGGLPGTELDTQLYDLNRVEVLRGPQGTLYGQGSVGGTIRYILNKPKMNQIEFRGDLGYETTDKGDASQRLRALINVPLGDKMALRIAGTYANIGGWIDQPAVSRENINDEQPVDVRATLLWQPMDSFELEALANIHRNDTGAINRGADEDYNFHQVEIAYPGATNPPGQATPSGSNEHSLYNITMRFDFKFAELLSTTTYLDFENDTHNVGYRLPILGDPATVPLFNVEQNHLQQTESFTQELRLSSTGTESLNWTIGGFLQNKEYRSDFAYYFSATPGTFAGGSIGDITRTNDSWALFGQADYAVTEQFILGAGVRYFEDDAGQIDNVDVTAEDRSTTFDSVNPRFFATYAFSDSATVYANVAKGFRSGGFNRLSAPLPAYQPESLWSYELGIKSLLWGGRMDAEFSLYYSEFTDIQEDVLSDQIEDLGRQYTSNGGDVEIKGFDLSLIMRMTDEFSLGIAGSVADTEYTAIDATVGTHVLGDPIDFIPDYHVSLWTTYNFDWTNSASGYVRLDYNQQGLAHWKEDSLGPWYVSTSDVLRVFNARLAWSAERLNVEVYANNILNDNGRIDAFSVIERHARLRPRTYGVRVGFNFK